MAQKQIAFFALIAFLLLVFALFLVFSLPKLANGPAGVTSNIQNGNQNSATNAGNNNQNSAVVSGILDFAAVEKNATQYNGTTLCLKGTYAASFETSAFNPDGADRNADPFSSSVWIDRGVPVSVLTCTGTGRQMLCSGSVTLCGRFSVAPSDEMGFGHLGGYRYQMTEVRVMTK